MNRSEGKRFFARDITGAIRANRQQVDVEWRAGTPLLRTIVLGQAVTDVQSEKLLHIAKNCPAARLLEGEVVIDTVA